MCCAEEPIITNAGYEECQGNSRNRDYDYDNDDDNVGKSRFASILNK